MLKKRLRSLAVVQLALLAVVVLILIVGKLPKANEGAMLQPATKKQMRAVQNKVEVGDVAYYATLPTRGKQRTEGDYYSRRAYDGAPPTIPHEIEEGVTNCLQCHSKGGFVKKFNAYAPRTPHPERANCQQCHVDRKVSSTFGKGTSFVGLKPARKVEGAYPPPMPHMLRNRENCLACHAGPGAMEGIRTSHPERKNCQQCHVAQSRDRKVEEFVQKPENK